MPNYKEITCNSALNKVSGRFPYKWDLNIYRGCEHGCRYCFAMYSHQYLGSDQYFSDIFIKTNVIEQLERKLASSSWKMEIINIGGVTDSYQPIESQYKIMPEILRLMIKYKNPCIISTKSDLILRDIDLISKLSEITYVNVAATITSMNDSTQRKLEPGSVSSKKRFSMLREFSKTKASTGLHVMPIIPFITDSRENIDELFSEANKCCVDYVIPGTLSLRGMTRSFFFYFIKCEYPELCQTIQEMYSSNGNRVEYNKKLYSMLNELRIKHSLSFNYSSIMREKLKQDSYKQLSLFD